MLYTITRYRDTTHFWHWRWLAQRGNGGHGRGFSPPWTQTREAILAMKELWTKDEAAYHGRYYNFPPVLSFPKPTQKPHPPVLLGGTARNVLQRVVEWGDGWMPNRIAADAIRRGRHTLNELAEQAGRDPKSIEILAFGFSGQFRSRTAIEALADAGANRVTIWLDQTAGDAALAEMDQMARQVLV